MGSQRTRSTQRNLRRLTIEQLDRTSLYQMRQGLRMRS